MSIFRRFILIPSLLASIALLSGCFLEGDDGAPGPQGEQGPAGVADQATLDGLNNADADLQAQIDDIVQAVELESCSACHGDVGEEEHQAIYDDYKDATEGDLAISINTGSVVSGCEVTCDFSVLVNITDKGVPLAALSLVDNTRFYLEPYNVVEGVEFANGTSKSLSAAETDEPGQYELTASGLTWDPSDGSILYVSVARGLLDEPELPASNHVSMYADLAVDGMTYGEVSYVSAANAAGCVKCHDSPYKKHGYLQAKVTDSEGDLLIPEFGVCKNCHFDDRAGSHEDWQYMVDDPFGWATGAEPSADYSYKRNLMNDVHMSHAMEFPYPQSMANCATCHEGKLESSVLTEENMVLETCKSCHPVTGDPEYAEGNRAPALVDVIPHLIPEVQLCSDCHLDAGGIAPAFASIHTGYDERIYTADGTRYSTIYSVSVDGASYNSATSVLTVDFSANSADIAPYLMVGLYGYGTKDILVAPHDRDENRNRLMEFAGPGDVYDPVAGTGNPRLLSWTANGLAVTAEVDLSAWTDIIGDSVERAMIAVTPPNVYVGEVRVAANADSLDLDLLTNAVVGGPDSDIVDEDGCNQCHDALAVSFHGGSNRSTVKVCRLCHAPKNGGSHLEMQSRSIDSYVHAIHSFQAFDPGDINFADPVDAKRYALHIEHTFPKFETIRNCEACHKEGTFNVPDQSKSLPSVSSGSDALKYGWYTLDEDGNPHPTATRNIGVVPSYVTGPASRACGGCHRADLINEDAAGELAAWNQHTKTFGYLVENPDGSGSDLYFMIVDKIMSMFQ